MHIIIFLESTTRSIVYSDFKYTSEWFIMLSPLKNNPQIFEKLENLINKSQFWVFEVKAISIYLYLL